MAQKYKGLRVFLLMLALGLSSVSFFKSLYGEFIVATIDLPQIVSNSPLIISPENTGFTSCCGGGSGPDGPSKPQPTINTLGTTIRPYIVENAEVQYIGLQNADLTESKITNSDFSNANLRKANFSNASISYSSFMRVNFKNANFSGTKLFGSDLTEADFSGAKMKRANFAHSGFENAILTNADLTDANLSDAELISAKGLTYEQLNKALINEFTSLPAKFESKRAILLAHSKQRMRELKKEMKAKELELFANDFDFLD